MAIAHTAIASMLKQPFFDICVVREVSKVIGSRHQGQAFEMLKALHCVHFSQMPPLVLESIPGLLREVFESPQLDDEVVSSIFKGIRA